MKRKNREKEKKKEKEKEREENLTSTNKVLFWTPESHYVAQASF